MPKLKDIDKEPVLCKPFVDDENLSIASYRTADNKIAGWKVVLKKRKKEKTFMVTGKATLLSVFKKVEAFCEKI